MEETFSIIKIAMPYMQELANFTNEEYILPFLMMERCISGSNLSTESVNLMRSILGERADMHCTGIGKAMLANLSEEEINAYLQRDLAVYTDHTISDPVQLRAELEATRQRGYAIDDMEHELG